MRKFLDKLIPKRRAESKQDVLINLRHAEQDGIVDSEAYEMMQRVMFVNDMQVRDIMIPRSNMITIETQNPLEECLDVMVDSGHSRFPIYDQDADEIVGMLLAKDLLRFFDEDNQDKFNMSDLARPMVFVPESKRLNILLSEFRKNRHHMAIVVDEFGHIAGLVTIEDVLEQIVGDIEDEHDIEDEESMVRALGQGEAIIKSILPMEEFNEFFNSDLREDVSDTIGGLIAQTAGYIPQQGEKLEINGFCFEIIHADSRRLHLIRVKQLEQGQGDSA